jgi:ubiquinone/menaquinone biosynthesis C-methylase UbiE
MPAREKIRFLTGRLSTYDRFFDVIDAQAIPYAGASFDAVVANHMLYHVQDRPRAFSEIRRALKPGGQLFVATNGQDHMAELWAMVMQAAAPIAAQIVRSCISVWRTAASGPAEARTPKRQDRKEARHED